MSMQGIANQCCLRRRFDLGLRGVIVHPGLLALARRKPRERCLSFPYSSLCYAPQGDIDTLLSTICSAYIMQSNGCLSYGTDREKLCFFLEAFLGRKRSQTAVEAPSPFGR